jgi:hypothetical protein
MWMNTGQMGWGSGYGGMFGWAPMLLWWALAIIGIAMLAKWLFGPFAGDRRFGRSAARGEIDREEFERRKRDLNG